MGLQFCLAPMGRALLFTLMLPVSACNPFGDSVSGVCSDTGVSTYRFSGAWKKVYGYDSPRTPTELETDFHLLMIEPGDRLCEAGISNTVSTGANYRALYRIDVNKKTVDMQYDVENLPQPDGEISTVRYSFTGSCDDTEMLLRYPDGTSERYEYYSPTVEAGSCDPE